MVELVKNHMTKDRNSRKLPLVKFAFSLLVWFSESGLFMKRINLCWKTHECSADLNVKPPDYFRNQSIRYFV